MNKSKLLFIALSSITFGLLFAIGVMAWTSPPGNPPTGGGAIYYSGGNVGIGTTTPTTAKLVVNGTIAASSPVNNSDVTTKAWVVANAGGVDVTPLIGAATDAASMSTTLFGGQQSIYDYVGSVYSRVDNAYSAVYVGGAYASGAGTCTTYDCASGWSAIASFNCHQPYDRTDVTLFKYCTCYVCALAR